MKRFLVLALVAVVLTRQAAFGTLFVVVPANGGFVVAADTRNVFVNTNCDGVTKIFHPKQRRNTVVLAAGTPFVVQFDKPPNHPCEYMKSGPRMLDIPRLVSMRLDARKNDVLSKSEVNRIANDSFLKVKAFDRANRKVQPLKYYIGFGFQVAIVSYDEKHATVLMGAFAVHVDSKGTPELMTNTSFYRGSKADKLEIKLFGEKDFGSKYVRTPDQMEAIRGKPIGQVSLTDATSAALQYIIEAEKPAEPDIGGPIDVATITRDGVQIKRH